MSDYSIAVIVGSLRRDSINRRLADALAGLAPEDFTLAQHSIGDLPLYNQDDDEAPAEEVLRLKAAVQAAQGVLFVTPEYNRSVPGVLKNAIDHGSRPYGQAVWTGKPSGVIGASIGPSGAVASQTHLRTILAAMGAPTLEQPEANVFVGEGFFDETGAVADPEVRAALQAWMAAFAGWVRTHAG